MFVGFFWVFFFGNLFVGAGGGVTFLFIDKNNCILFFKSLHDKAHAQSLFNLKIDFFIFFVKVRK